MGCAARGAIAVLTAAFIFVLGLWVFAPRPPVEVPEPAPRAAPPPPAERQVGLQGKLKSIGSDVIVNLLQLWSESFRELHPGVAFEICGGGNGHALAAVNSGEALLGPISRSVKKSEVQAFEEKHGYPPTEIRTALDVLAVFVHQENPIRGLTIRQLHAIYSRSLEAGGAEDIRTWGQLGLSGDWADRPVLLHGRYSSSGVHVFFRERVLGYGDFRDQVEEHTDTSSLLQAVARDRHAIGYAGIGYTIPGVRAVPVAETDTGPWVEAAAAAASSGAYPLARAFSMCIKKTPGMPLDPLLKGFLTFVLSGKGQEVVVKNGYTPLPAPTLVEELARLED